MKFSACERDLIGIDNKISGFDYSNENLRGIHILLGTKVKYTCNSGHIGGEATCKSDGEWDPPVRCRFPVTVPSN